jgi:protein tyrosine phosphatase (PTP) superfamily phosphohydrolase (DUF442 family)
MNRTIFVVLALAAGCAKSAGAQSDHDATHQGPAMNFHRINPQLATGGHFVGDAAAELARQGVTLVIDLRDEPPAEEREQLEAVGIRWVNIPVVWAAPERADFEDFSKLMAANKSESVFVQCQANYRASAMTYLYRVARQGVSEPEARKDLDAIWTPEGTWELYMDEILETEGKN